MEIYTLRKRTYPLALVLITLILFWYLDTQNKATFQQKTQHTEVPQYADRSTKPSPVIEKQDDLRKIDPQAYARNKQFIKNLLTKENKPVKEIKDYGYRAIPILTELYNEAESNREKIIIADLFWRLGWNSPEIEKTLIKDLDTDDQGLKINVQWGIAKSTQSDIVIEKILYSSIHDPNPIVRDKASCALASDFIHISPSQRIKLLRGLVEGLSSDIHQVRNSSILALKIQTGQTKGFTAADNIKSRKKSIDKWHVWLDEYQKHI